MIKKLLITCLSTFCATSAYAEALGWYSILELGHTRQNYTVANENLVLYQNQTLLGTAIPATKNAVTTGAKVDVGYTFNDFIAAELSFAKYGKTTFENIYGIQNANVNLSLGSLGLVAVTKYPMGPFRLDAKIGGAWAVTKGSYNPTATNFVVPGQGTIVLPTLQQRKFRPLYGVEAAYDFNEVFGAAVGWQRIPAGSGIQTTDFAYIGLVYHFDQYLR